MGQSVAASRTEVANLVLILPALGVYQKIPNHLTAVRLSRRYRQFPATALPTSYADVSASATAATRALREMTSYTVAHARPVHAALAFRLHRDMVILHWDRVRLHRDRVRLHRDRVRLHKARIRLQRARVRLHWARVRLHRDRVRLYSDRVRVHRDGVRLHGQGQITRG